MPGSTGPKLGESPGLEASVDPILASDRDYGRPLTKPQPPGALAAYHQLHQTGL